MLITCWSCNPTKFLGEGEYLHVKNTVEVEQEKTEFVEPVNKAEVKTIIRPRPNNKFLGTRFPQWLYFKAIDNNDTNAIERVMLNSFAKAPTLLDTSLVEESEEKIVNYLFSKGYFYPEVESEISVKNKKSTATFQLQPGHQHLYDEFSFSNLDSVENASDIVKGIELSDYITTGQNYDVVDFQNLRSAIVNNALERGYYKFGKSSIYIEPDTLSNDRKVDIDVVIENENDSLFNQPFYIRNIYMKTGRGSLDSYQEPISYNGKLFSSSKSVDIRPKLLDRFILLEKDSLYQRSEHVNTIDKLIDLPIISYANVEFRETEINDTLYLDALISANRRAKMSVRAEPTISEFGGPAISAEVGFEHRNLFNGAEHFQFTIGGGFESAQTQDGSTRVFGTSYIQAEPKITFPRLLLLDQIYPNTYENTINQSTSVTARFANQNRRGLYQLFETSLGQSWDWQSSPHNRHTLSIIDVALLKSRFSDYYQSILDIYPSNAYNLESRIILGNQYTYTYTNKLKQPNQSYYNFKGTVESAGNLAYTLFAGKEDTLSIGNVDVSRYIRGILDYQYNFRITEKSNFVTRVSGGVAYPIGAVKSIPAIKQFFAGGSNSMRAWRARSLGPGAFDYRNDTTFNPDQLVDQRGDVKLEANAEYRFPFTTLFGQQVEGAVFTDVGNIWSLYEPEDDNGGRPGAEFSDTFYEELAVGSGVGMRLKIQNFLNIRADMAWKIRDPILPQDERWVEEPFTWNNSNITVGIGYPFFN